MSIVGIIANPAAGKDIRRLVAHASTFDNHQKVNIVRRVLLGLDAAGVDEAIFMPDSFGIGERALDGLAPALKAHRLDMRVEFTQEDSTRAAHRLRALGVQCIVTLGGDGTNRAVAKGCEDVPLMPISTGTNNVFPVMLEGTVAGLAAGVVARGIVSAEQAVRSTQRLEIMRDGTLIDIALVDAAVYHGQFVGSRAIWDAADIRQVVLSRTPADCIGLSSIGGFLAPSAFGSGQGLAIEMGGDDLWVIAPIAPGLIRPVPVAGYRILNVGDSADIHDTPSVLALDGERELVIRAGESVRIRLSSEGPRVVDHQAALRSAAAAGFFVRHGKATTDLSGTRLALKGGSHLNG